MIVHRKKWKQTLAGAIVSLGAVCEGIVTLLPPSAESPFKGPRTYFPVSEQERSLIACILMVSVAAGNLVSGIAADAFGPKKSLVAMAIPLVPGFILVVTSNTYLLLILGRALVGFASGASVVLAALYICESCEASIRGSISTLIMLFMSLGNFVMYILDDLILNWNTTSVIALCLPVILFLTVLGLPESPRYLIVNDKESEAREALEWLREDGYDVNEELADIKASVSLAAKDTCHNPIEILHDGFSAKLYVCLLCLGLIFGFCGGQVFLSFAESLFIDLHTSLPCEHLPIVLGLVQVAGVLFAFSLVNVFGRRFFLIMSGIGMFVCWSTISVCTFFYPPGTKYSLVPSHFPSVVLMFGVFFYSVGYLPLSIPLVAEILPLHIRAIGTASITMISTLIVSILLATYMAMKTALGIHGMFLFCASFAFISIFFPILFIPETKDKNLEEIDTLLRKRGIFIGLN